MTKEEPRAGVDPAVPLIRFRVGDIVCARDPNGWLGSTTYRIASELGPGRYFLRALGDDDFGTDGYADELQLHPKTE